MRSVRTADGRTLTLCEGGDPGGVPIVVQGGMPGSSVLYEPHVRDAESKGIRLVSYDRPGYAGSTRAKGRTVADCAADVAAVCDALGIERFCVLGVSAGGPHALAAAALLPDRVAAVAALAPFAPFDAAGLDFYEGMDRENIDDFAAVFDGEEALCARVDRGRRDFLAASPEQMVDVFNTLLCPADLAAMSSEMVAFLLEATRAGLEQGADGWFDDVTAFTRSWGFDLASISVPVLHWQGEQDRFVPTGHGVWLAQQIPGVESHLSPDDGHITVFQYRTPEAHTWLRERFNA